jgi:hypothetical protein
MDEGTWEDVGYCAESGFDGRDLGGVFEDVRVVFFEDVHLRGDPVVRVKGTFLW